MNLAGMSFDDRQALYEARDRILFGGYAMALFFVPLFLGQWAATLLFDTRDVFASRAVFLSLAMDLFLVFVIAVFIAANHVARRIGDRAIFFHYRSVLVFLPIFAGAALAHTYLTGLLGSTQTILIIAVNFCLLLYLRRRHAYWIIGVSNAVVFSVLLLEFRGILPYAPFMRDGARLGAVFLDPRVIVMNVAVYLVITGVIAAVTIDVRRSMAKSHIRLGEQSRAILQTAIDGFVLTDLEGRLLKVNDAYCRMSGYSEQELLTMRIADLVVAESATDTPGRIRKLVERGEERLDSQLRRKDGKLLDVEASVVFKPAEPDNAGYLVVFLRDITERKAALEDVRRSREELRAIARRMTDAHEAERQRISRELHDTIGQTLSVVGINLSLVRNQLPAESPGDQFRRIDDSLRQIEEITDGIRGVIADLRPPMLDDYGLLSSLQWYAEHFAKRTGLAIEVRGEILQPRLPISAATAFFRIAQEALNNAFKHAEAGRVTVALTEKAGVVTLTLADDGKGFDPTARAEHPRHCGLTIMRERALGAGAAFRLESAPGRGTVVRIEWPRADGAAADRDRGESGAVGA
jgi:PAS domain S-box-containing protein